MADGEQIRVLDSPERLRYEIWRGETRAGFIAYRAEPGTLVLLHTEIDPAFAGQALGSRLVAGTLEGIRARGLKLVPLCPFVAAYIRRHPGSANLVADDAAASDRR